MISHRSSAPLPFKLLILAWGILALFWLPVEDVGLHWVIAFAAALCALIGARYTIQSQAESPNARGQDRPWWSSAAIGALAGLGVVPMAAFLMVFKSGLHGHPSPDFTLEQVYAVLYRTPFWMAGGLLVGLGLGLFQNAGRNL